MVRSMISHSTLSGSLQGEALKTTTYIFNRVPTKITAKTPYKLWTSQKPILKHFHIQGYLVQTWLYWPQEKKLDSKMVSSYFIGYFEHSRGYQCYNPTLEIIFEMEITQLFEDVEFRGRNKIKDITFKEESISILKPIPIVAFNNI